MNKSISYFTDPEIIRQYQNSSYDDEHHFAVSQMMEITGIKSCNFEDFKNNLYHTITDMCKKDSGFEIIIGDNICRATHISQDVFFINIRTL